MTQQHKTVLEKEFELERVTLFSDAVFAIAITLLIIDIKWPDLPVDLRGVDLIRTFRPTFFQAFSFVLSFFFIGRAWYLHLYLFRYLTTYDRGLIIRNLFFLFFIVIFPFAAAGMPGKIREGFVVPFFVYFINLGLVNLMQWLICHYIFYKKPSLSIPGEEAEKKYVYIRAKNGTLAILFMTGLLLLINIFFPGNNNAVEYGGIAIAVVIAFVSRRTRKYKPVTLTHH